MRLRDASRTAGLSAMDEIIVAAAKSGEQFVQAYYSAQDATEAERSRKVAALYLQAARITWNGNPVAFADLPALLDRMPKSKHEVQAFDCHPIPGSTGPPTLALSVNGQVRGTQLVIVALPLAKLTLIQVTYGSEPAPLVTGIVRPKDFDFLPRVFAQSLILVADATTKSDGSPNYLISADSFRFC
ncbi:hypothetical protein OIO90_005742 [Microbotryomycetes sp. JL221]|nr:hypothetical protein OIO90_005742 [Microbotryomycetes sp. JL221]